MHSLYGDGQRVAQCTHVAHELVLLLQDLVHDADGGVDGGAGELGRRVVHVLVVDLGRGFVFELPGLGAHKVRTGGWKRFVLADHLGKQRTRLARSWRHRWRCGPSGLGLHWLRRRGRGADWVRCRDTRQRL